MKIKSAKGWAVATKDGEIIVNSVFNDKLKQGVYLEHMEGSKLIPVTITAKKGKK